MDAGTVTLVLVVAIVVSLFKPFIELKLSTANTLHDTTIRLVAIVVGIVAAFVDYAVHTAAWQNGAAIESTLGRGLAAGVGAVVTYHLLTSDVWNVLGNGNTITTIPPGTQIAVPVQQSAPAVVIAPTGPMPTPPVLPDSAHVT